ncbi:MAG: hypothetical protein Q9225_006346 [Loekoesia sp. 1 TL-2023]
MWHAITAQIFVIWTAIAAANVEKNIFLAPEAVKIPQGQLYLDQLQLETLTSATPTLRRQLRAAFPTPSQPRGPTSWFLLDSLTPYQRYEIRVCWLATQPTDFTVNTYRVPEVFESPELVSSLALYSEERQSLQQPETSTLNWKHRAKSSLLFLKIDAAADYLTTNTTLMQNVPWVDVDINPYLLNLLPKSLVPIGIHLTIVAVAAWYLSKAIWSFLDQVSKSRGDPKNAANQQEKDI